MTSEQAIDRASSITSGHAASNGQSRAGTNGESSIPAAATDFTAQQAGVKTPQLSQKAPETPVSPSNSLSSISSSESTRKLIKSLSTNELGTGKIATLPSHIVVSPVLQQSSTVASTPSPNPVESKKPIKFTVRKVSREGPLPVVAQPKPAAKKEYLYGNIPENRHKVVERKTSDKAGNIQANQAKYDSYVTRIDKIDKEIRFLTNLLPPYNVEIDYATRTKITRAIEKLGMKKDEIEKKKHSLGISISRSWREYDENSTWVRSVSNH